MEILINPTATRIWRDANTLQIGFGQQKVVLENLQLRHEAFIEALYCGLTPEQAKEYGRHLKMRTAETQALITALKPVLLSNTSRVRPTNSAGETKSTEFDSGEVASIASLATDDPLFVAAQGEINRASHLLSSRGESVWSRRQSRVVFLSHLDRCGLLVAKGLASAGFGALVVGETNEAKLDVLARDLSEMPLSPQLLRLPELTENQINRIDLAVLLGQQLIEPQRFATWMNRRTPHIAAVAASAAEDLQPLVSHVMIAGSTPCWHCLEYRRRASDQAWPDMASQLIGREQRFDSASLSLFLAAKIVEAAVSWVDNDNGFGEPNRGFKWEFNPECGCRLAEGRT
ncbi:MAG: hypothetical protein RL196_817 [Actinomycetota bacterium]|jgi:hypothetical protein